jgi:hypothetical protein
MTDISLAQKAALDFSSGETPKLDWKPEIELSMIEADCGHYVYSFARHLNRCAECGTSLHNKRTKEYWHKYYGETYRGIRNLRERVARLMHRGIDFTN